MKCGKIKKKHEVLEFEPPYKKKYVCTYLSLSMYMRRDAKEGGERINTDKHAVADGCVFLFEFVCVLVYVNSCMYAHVCVFVCVCVCVSVCVYPCVSIST
jgi:hypothetical protein